MVVARIRRTLIFARKRSKMLVAGMTRTNDDVYDLQMMIALPKSLSSMMYSGLLITVS